MGKRIFDLTVRDMIEISMLVAIAVILDTFLKVPFAATGGSINVAMLPLFIIALRHGPFKGFIAGGIVFGLITCLIDAYGIAYYIGDYLVGFGSIFVVGLVGNLINSLYKKDTKGKILSFVFLLVSIILSGIIRLAGGIADSMIFYELSFIESFIYNIGYIGISLLVVAIILCAILPIIINLNENFKTAYLENDDVNIENEE